MSSSCKPSPRLRTVGVIAHINAGKTTLSERILFDAGKQRWFGDVESGTATMDWMVEEQERGISITAAVTTVDWRDGAFRIQVVDTPGHVDFTAEVERCLRVLDGVVVVLDGVRGVESQTEAVWRRALDAGLPALVFVNKLDRQTADFEASLATVASKLELRVVRLSLPLRRDKELVGVYDVITDRVVVATRGAGDAGSVDLKSCGLDAGQRRAAREAVIEACADVDESIMEDFAFGRDVSAERLWPAMRAAVAQRLAVPVFAGSALQDLGVDLLLDGVCLYLPDPTPAPAPACGSESAAAVIYKVHVEDDGALTAFLRVLRGRVVAGDRLCVSSSGKEIMVDSLWRPHVMEREPVAEARMGEFVALRLMEPLQNGEVLHTPGVAEPMQPMRFSEPVMTMALEPHAAEDREVLEQWARQVAIEDPTLTVRRDPLTDRLLVSGMGELHLEVFVNRLNRRLEHPARFGRPTVQLFESVRREATDAAELKRRVGSEDREGEARVVLAVGPAVDEGEAMVRTADALVDVDPEALKRVHAELDFLMKTGVVEPIPTRRLWFEVRELELGGDLEVARALAVEATITAARRAVQAAGRVELEPVVEFVVEGPSENFSSILADLRSRGAVVGQVVPSFGATRVEGRVPLAELIGYAGPLRNMTQGKGTLRFDLAEFAVRGSR